MSNNNKGSNFQNFKKNPFLKHKVERELKAKSESEATAKVYAEFVASFQDSDEEVVDIPTQPTADQLVSSKKPRHPFNQYDIPTSSRPVVQNSASTPSHTNKKVRMLDTFLEELKQTHTNQTNTTSITNLSDPNNLDGLQTSTNLYLSNLSSNIDEAQLCNLFAKFGSIASLKILWPRGNEVTQRKRNGAFVSFMSRKSAEEALKAMDNYLLDGVGLRVSWGKPIVLPSVPYFEANEGRNKVKTGLPFNAKLVSNKAKKASYQFVPPPTSFDSKASLKDSTKPPPPSDMPRLEVEVEIPKDPQLLRLIHRTIERVLIYGFSFEAILMQKESDNFQFKFLFDSTDSNHIYYRWKLYSLLQGDSLDKWRVEPFQMFDVGPYFIPPPLPKVTDDDMTKAKVLNKPDRKLFLRMLDQLTIEKRKIGVVMVFILDHKLKAEQTVKLICDHITKTASTDSNLELKLMKSLAYLYLISDILYNVDPTVPQLWRLRAAIEVQLEGIFVTVHAIWKSIEGRIQKEGYKLQILNLLHCWETSRMFPTHSITRLHNLLMYNDPDYPKLDQDRMETVSTTFNDDQENDQTAHLSQNDGVEQIPEEVKAEMEQENVVEQEEEDLDMFA